MNPININITNLVGTIVVVGDDATELSAKITQTLLQTIKSVQEISEQNQDKSSKQSLDDSATNQDCQ